MRITFSLDNQENKQSLVVQRTERSGTLGGDRDVITITIVNEDGVGQFVLDPHERFKLIDALLSIGK